MAESSSDDELEFRLRSYQEEMVEASLKENVIVKMDTGSGKTQIAVARAEAALRHADLDKLVWIIAPTVSLVHQHEDTFNKYLSAFQTRRLTGDDGVDHWSDQTTWDHILKNIRIVISTPAVLSDALDHAFVKLERLVLIVFDEAHNYIKNHAGAQIMKNHYLRRLQDFGRGAVPAILGLSASVDKPQQLEALLCARVITPRRYRSELLHHVNRPDVEYVRYNTNGLCWPQKLQLLHQLQDEYNHADDPYFKSLSPEAKLHFKLQGKVPMNLKELRALSGKADHICEQLGPTMAEFYVESSVRAIVDSIENRAHHSADWTEQERTHFLNILRPMLSTAKKRKAGGFEEQPVYSHKVQILIDFLEREWSEGFTGLLFVQQRALAHTLAYLLAQHKFQRAQLRVQSFVGTSGGVDKAKRFVEKVLPNEQKSVLGMFKSPTREVNLIVATEVLGEGIDVQQCHLVICFDMPPHLRSYVQRRGRARTKNSKYAMMLDEGTSERKLKQWQKLEAELDEAYQAAESQFQLSKSLEQQDDPGSDKLQYRVASTDALLHMGNALGTLYHVCQSITSTGGSDTQPQFTYIEDEFSMVEARVSLPISFDISVRHATSSRAWKTEKMAVKDAAFVAVRQLHEAGLLNDHLLPFREEKQEAEVSTDSANVLSSICLVPPRIDPWKEAARMATTGEMTWHALSISIHKRGSRDEPINLDLLAPTPLYPIDDFNLYYNQDVTYTVSSLPSETRVLNTASLTHLQQQTRTILASASGLQMVTELDDFPFAVDLHGAESAFGDLTRQVDDHDLMLDELRARLGDRVCQPEVISHKGFGNMLFRRFTQGIRVEGKSGSVRYELPIADYAGQLHDVVEAVKLPKRRDFLHLVDGKSRDAQISFRYLPLHECRTEALSTRAVIASKLLPSILRRVELALSTRALQSTLFAALAVQNTSLLQQALTSRKANELDVCGNRVDYERMEFLGDALLKFLTSLHLMAEKPMWREGYLTREKSSRVSNDTLSETCQELGLTRFIIADGFTGVKWSPPYCHRLLTAQEPMVQASRKMLADVVESTIGAAYLDGGMLKVIQCCKLYFPQQSWHSSMQEYAALLAENASVEHAHLETLERVIDYKFRKPSLLLEAITHEGYRGALHENCTSYDRLEFLGDAVLDYLVTRRLYNCSSRTIPHYEMHSIRTAVVSGHMLGYLCMEHHVIEDRAEIPRQGEVSMHEVVKYTGVPRYIWQFVRASQPRPKDDEALQRYKNEGPKIREQLKTRSYHPWKLLSRLAPGKIFSDVIESILGAIFIDSGGDLDLCDDFLERIGLMQILDRILKERIVCMHPKEGLTAEVARMHNLGKTPAERRATEARPKRLGYVYREGNGMYSCQVQIDGTDIGKRGSGKTKDEATAAAAHQVLKLLRKPDGETMQDADGLVEALDAVDGAVETEESQASVVTEEVLVPSCEANGVDEMEVDAHGT